MSVCLCLSVCLSVYISICVCICVPVTCLSACDMCLCVAVQEEQRIRAKQAKEDLEQFLLNNDKMNSSVKYW